MKHRKLRLAIVSITLFSVLAGHAGSISISVNDDLKKDTETDKSGGGSSSKRTEAETQTYMLDIAVFNGGAEGGTFDLEWYFFKRSFNNKGDKGNPVICEKGKATLNIKARERVYQKVTSEGLNSSETKTTTNSRKRGRSRSNQTKSYSGAVYAGYAVLVRQNGTVVAKKATDSCYLEDEWLGKLNPRTPTPKSSGNGARKRK